MGCVYQAKNVVNGKSYIGKTVQTLRGRIFRHISTAKRGSVCYFPTALRKHGQQSFLWMPLFLSDDNNDLISMERVFIKLLNTKLPNGYNLTDGGEGTLGLSIKGRKFTEEHRRKLSLSQIGNTKALGKKFTQEHKDKIGAANKGKKKITPEWRVKMTAARIGKKRGKYNMEKFYQNPTVQP